MALREERVIFLIGAIIVVVALGLIFFEVRYAVIAPGLALQDGKLSEAQRLAIDTILDVAKTFTTWAIAIIGGTAFFLKLNFDKGVILTRVDLAFSSVIFLLCFISIGLWQIAAGLAGELLAVEQFPLEDTSLRRILLYQYLSGLAAICLFGVYVFRFFWVRIDHNHRNELS
jgi:hypothetical protein